jgi:group I intron endonuclease
MQKIKYPSGIYKITNKVNGRNYIGSAFNLKKRKREHFALLKKKNHSNRYLQTAYNKYGEENFEFNILFFCDKENLIFYEQRAIDNYSSYNKLYNLAPRAGRPLGIKHTEEMNRLKSERQKGHIVTKETREKISKSQKGRKVIVHPNYGMKGKHHSEETKRKISISSHNRKYSLETILKRKESRAWYNHSEETIKKISEGKIGEKNPNYGKFGELNPFYGKKHSKESISKFSKSKMKKFTDIELEQIYQMKKNKIPISHIAKKFNCSSTPILRILKGILK